MYLCIICAILKGERGGKNSMELLWNQQSFDRWSVRTTRKKNANIGKITEKKMSGKYPQLINTKKEKEELEK